MKNSLEKIINFLEKKFPNPEVRWGELKAWLHEQTAEQSVHPTLLTYCPHCEGLHDDRVACPEYLAKSQSG